MNQEKARKYLCEIDQWINDIKVLDLIVLNNNNNSNSANNNGERASNSSDYFENEKSLSNTGAGALDDCYSNNSYSNNTQHQNNSLITSTTNNNNNHKSVKASSNGDCELISLLFLNDLVDTATSSASSTSSSSSCVSSAKHTSLLKNYELISSQIGSLCSMFEKRKEQLKKTAYPCTSKPVQRVEPQLLFLDSRSGNSSSSSCSSPSLNNHQSYMHQIDSNKFNTTNSSLIKRDSMNKVNKIK